MTFNAYSQSSEYESPVDMDGRCRASVYQSGAFRSTQCSRKGVNEEGGMLWCKIHTPSIKEKKQAEKSAEWEAEWAASRAKDKIKAAAPALLEVLEKVLKRCPDAVTGGKVAFYIDVTDIKEARAIIKAARP